MGFLESVGRSGAVGQLGDSIFNNVIKMGQAQRADEESVLRQQQEQLKIEDMKKKQEFLHAPRNIRGSVLYLSMPEEYREKFVEKYISAGYADKDGTTTAFKRNQFINEDAEGRKLVFEGIKMKATLDFEKAYQKLQNAELGGDKDAIAKATEGVKVAGARLAAAEGSYAQVMKLGGGGDELSAWQKKQAELAEERIKQGEARLDQGERRLQQQETMAEKRFRESQRKQDDLLKQQVQTNERNMRKDFEALPEVKNYADVTIKAGQMEEALSESQRTNNFVAVDQALITMFNKMLDPTSVVRESEYARTSTDIALLNRIKGKAEKVATGGAGLTVDERRALYDMSQRFLGASKRRYVETANEWRGLSTQYGLNPDRVVFRNVTDSVPGKPESNQPKRYKVDASGNVVEVK